MSKEHPLLLKEEIIRSMLNSKIPGQKIRRLYASSKEKEIDPQHLANRIMNGIVEIDKRGCWIWGRSTSVEYAAMTIRGKTHRCHRLAWMLTYQKQIPKGMFICHKCDNRKCVNPKHLFLGTQFDNMQDMVAKGRDGKASTSMPGESNPSAKLTAKNVVAIRKRLTTGESQQSIANNFGVSQGQISHIKLCLQWQTIAG